MINVSDFEYLPKHLAVIMDGNRRWAICQGIKEAEGYKEGGKVAYNIVQYCLELKIPYLTLYAFSMENWLRSKTEVDTLISLLYSTLCQKIDLIHDSNVKLNFIGDFSLLPEKVVEMIEKAQEATARNTGLVLTIAISYGARQEIAKAVRDIVKNNIEVNSISESTIKNFLYTKDLPELDLLIRTGDKKRLSNFLLWQSAYTELYFCNIFWPDFSYQHLAVALKDYIMRDRKYGK
ncbi:polyprenyl diphosphate synthase [Wolbachia endosymbiont of Pentidionis agamae]|uniref:polyprenyl diphosphate synthase n=1 Tax=Wolbachia endosymbiont of Pentidionis agamae TaxID=3110435 RepID=UPI002FD3DE7F